MPDPVPDTLPIRLVERSLAGWNGSAFHNEPSRNAGSAVSGARHRVWHRAGPRYHRRMARLNYHRINDRLLAGAMPFRDDHVEALRAEGVSSVVNLCEEREYWEGERDLLAAAYLRSGMTEHLLPVRDGSTVPADVLDRAVAIAGADGGSVYVHCRGGRERSATVTAAVLSRLDALTIDDALRVSRERRPIFAPLEWQVTGLHRWASATPLDGGRPAPASDSQP